VFAHVFGAAGYGVYSYATGWVLLLVIPAALGYERLLLRELAAAKAKGAWQEMAAMLAHANRAVLLSGSVIGSVAAALGAIFLGPPFQLCFVVMMVLVPIVALVTLRRGVLQALGSPELAQMPEQIVRPVVTALFASAIFLAQGGAQLEPVYAGIAAVFGGMIALVTAIRSSRRRLPHVIAPARRPSSSPLPRAWAFLILSALWQGNYQIPLIILGSTGQPAQVAYYSVAASAANLGVMVLNGVNVTLAPRMSALYAEGKLADLQMVVRDAARTAFVCSLFTAAFLIILGRPLLTLYGANFHAAYVPLLILLCGQMCNAAVGPVGMLLTMARAERSVMWAVGLGSLISLLLALWLAQPLGANGAAIAAAANLVTWNSILAAVSVRRLGISVTPIGSRAHGKR
jgi:O-antigen/teichoic acid export membrane protein